MFPDPTNFERLAVGFTLTFVRVAGLMLLAPLFGSARVPRRFKMMIALVMTIPMFNFDNSRVAMPTSTGHLVVGLLGELGLGLTLGMTVSLVFIAAQWSGQMIGQQIGFNLSETIDPQYGGGGMLVGDLSFMLATAIFLIIGGHRQLLIGTFESLQSMPPLSVRLDRDVLDVVIGFLTAATHVAIRLAAPIFVTMIIVDVAIGCISRTMPQLNVMSVGTAVRSVIGLGVLVVGIGVSASVILDEIVRSLERYRALCR